MPREIRTDRPRPNEARAPYPPASFAARQRRPHYLGGRQTMRWSVAIGAGAVGAVLLTCLGALLRMAGVEVNFELLLGSMATGATGTGGWLVGFLIHVCVSCLIALAYVAIFELVLKGAGAARGAALGALHTVASGLALGLVPAIHPLIPNALPAPGMFLAGLGAAGVLAFIALHVLYGALVGAWYDRAGRADLS